MLFKIAAIGVLLPPTSLAFAALLGLLIERRYRRIGRCLTWFSVLCLLVLTIPAVGGLLLLPLEYDLPLKPPENAWPQAIVILGGEVLRGRGNSSPSYPGPLSLERVRTGAALYRKTALPILVSGGSVLSGEAPIASLMADSLVHDFNVPVQWVEDASHDTWEDAHLSADILRKQGIKSVYVVTQSWHMRRALLAFEKAGMVATAAPTEPQGAPSLFAEDFVPAAGGWQTSYFAFHEWIGCAWYALR